MKKLLLLLLPFSCLAAPYGSGGGPYGGNVFYDTTFTNIVQSIGGGTGSGTFNAASLTNWPNTTLTNVNQVFSANRTNFINSFGEYWVYNQNIPIFFVNSAGLLVWASPPLGDGSAITNLDASALALNNVPSARLGTNASPSDGQVLSITGDKTSWITAGGTTAGGITNSNTFAFLMSNNITMGNANANLIKGIDTSGTLLGTLRPSLRGPGYTILGTNGSGASKNLMEVYWRDDQSITEIYLTNAPVMYLWGEAGGSEVTHRISIGAGQVNAPVGFVGGSFSGTSAALTSLSVSNTGSAIGPGSTNYVSFRNTNSGAISSDFAVGTNGNVYVRNNQTNGGSISAVDVNASGAISAGGVITGNGSGVTNVWVRQKFKGAILPAGAQSAGATRWWAVDGFVTAQSVTSNTTTLCPIGGYLTNFEVIVQNTSTVWGAGTNMVFTIQTNRVGLVTPGNTAMTLTLSPTTVGGALYTNSGTASHSLASVQDPNGLVWDLQTLLTAPSGNPTASFSWSVDWVHPSP